MPITNINSKPNNVVNIANNNNQNSILKQY